MSDHIFLYGPPGSGKSTLGLRLAHEIQRPFIDLDERIEKRLGRTIASVFEQEDEASFRVQNPSR